MLRLSERGGRLHEVLNQGLGLQLRHALFIHCVDKAFAGAELLVEAAEFFADVGSYHLAADHVGGDVAVDLVFGAVDVLGHVFEVLEEVGSGVACRLLQGVVQTLACLLKEQNVL